MIAVFVFLSVFVAAAHSDPSSIYGVAGFSNGASPLAVNTPSYPDFVAVPGSRTHGFVTSQGLLLTDEGLMISRTGDYFATMDVVLFGNETATPNVEYNTFLVINGTFDSESTNLVGASNTVTTNSVVQFHSANILRNLWRGSTLSIIINNGIGSEELVHVFAWSMTLHKL